MPHQCVHCGKMYPAGSRALVEGCKSCGSRFFFYIKDEQYERVKQNPIIISEEDKKKVEKDIRDIAGITDIETPVILDIESVRVAGSGKYEIDLVHLFNKNRPLVYKVEEGKYIIDLASTLSQNVKDIKGIKNPED